MLPANAEAPVRHTPPAEQPADEEDYWRQVLIETLQLGGNMPMRCASLASSAAKWGDYNRNAERNYRKLYLFKLIGRMKKEGRLRLIARHFVILTTPEEQERHREALLKYSQPVILPRPNV